jgi:hypothetical protein
VVTRTDYKIERVNAVAREQGIELVSVPDTNEAHARRCACS